MMAGYEVPPASASLRLQEFTVQVQPCPNMDVTVNPAGAFSEAETKPEVGAEPTLVTRKR
jgi:hypothetical protein